MEVLEGPAAIIMQSLGEGDVAITTVIATGMFGTLSKSMPGNARKFNFTDGGMGFCVPKGKLKHFWITLKSWIS